MSSPSSALYVYPILSVSVALLTVGVQLMVTVFLVFLLYGVANGLGKHSTTLTLQQISNALMVSRHAWGYACRSLHQSIDEFHPRRLT